MAASLRRAPVLVLLGSPHVQPPWRGRQPNKRLKLAGADRLKGTGVFAPWRARTVVHHPCSRGRVARSLSAIG
jgi:hypothetical protein